VNLSKLFTDSWKITWRSWRIWVLTLALFFTFLPAGIIGGLFSGAVSVASNPNFVPDRPWLRELQMMPPQLWLTGGITALVIMVAAAAVSWIIQAAGMRGASAAADGIQLSFSEMFALGRARFFTILKLSILFGLLIASLGLLPIFLRLFLPQPYFAALASGLLSTFLAPLNAVISIAILLVLMAVALEGVSSNAAFGRAWKVFRSGWAAFLLVFLVTTIAGVLVSLFIIPPLAIIFYALVVDEQALLLAVGCAGISAPMILLGMVFTGVFTLVLYTLAYRQAARISALPGLPPTS
jgi:hypothetical protein